MSESTWFRPWMIPAAVPLAATLVCSLGCLVGGPCGGLFWRYGIWQMGHCPVGDVRAGGSVEAWSLLRGREDGRVSVTVDARWMARGEDSPRTALTARGTSARLELLDDEGELVDGFITRDEWRSGMAHEYKVELPAELPDGDYTLRAVVGIAGEQLTIDAPLPLYAPAMAHVALDRPLYEPGQAVHMRSVLLRRTDRSPLAERPGRWEIRDPQGVLVHREKDRAGAWGVADSTFYLASDAPVGAWTATWRSGEALDQVTFDVRPFTLPRFTVEATADERWFHPGQTLSLSGTARYTSGAPVQDAPVTVQLGVAEGRWPLPVEWEEPLTARTDAQGRFELDVGTIPEEELLTRELSVLSATVRVTDETGETRAGGSRLVISADDIRAEVLTELEGGLVCGFNNRTWVRVTTPDGVPMPGADLQVGNPLDQGARTYEARTDADGVAMLQLDPGDPISVPMPPVPIRIRPQKPDPVSLFQAATQPDSGSPSMAERRVLDRIQVGIEDCRYLVDGVAEVRLGVNVDAAGRVIALGGGAGDLDRCVADVVRRQGRFPAGEPRAFQLGWRVPDNLRTKLPYSLSTVHGSTTQVDDAVRDALLRARRCPPDNVGRSGAEVLSGTWSVDEGDRSVRFDLQRGSGSGLSALTLRCIEAELRGVRLPDPASEDALGGLVVRVQRQGRTRARKAQATFTTGYPVGVTATADGAELGTTLAVVGVGSVPPLRVRISPTLPEPGDTVTVDLLRGPSFDDWLPHRLFLEQGSVRIAEAELHHHGKLTVEFQIPEDGRGFYHVDTNGARGVVFVRDPDPLSLDLSTDQPAYAPGERATLTVRTRAGDTPTPAAVGLIGVDQSLGQLAPLLGPDDMGRVTVRATSDRPAFGAFDPRALALGRIRGEHASTAAVLALSSLPMDAAGDRPADAQAQASVNDMEVVTRRFWRARAVLVERVRAWEQSAAEGELLTNERLRELWTETVTTLEAEGTPTHDAFNRPLTLENLPGPLVERLDPREIASDATRLPEDVTSWPAWVDEEVR